MQEQVFDWLPEGTTHLAKFYVDIRPGGALRCDTYAFKYVDNELMVYTTDSDNEYPQWVKATSKFVRTNFKLYPIQENDFTQ